MLKLDTLAGDPGKKQKRKRVGRGEGSGQGCTAGKGHKGQQARSGGGHKGAAFEGGQMPLVRRLPKFGFNNTRFRLNRAEVTLRQLNRFEDGATVDRAALHAARLISKKTEHVKLIATGTLERKLTVRVNACSAKARQAVEAAGGQCETV
jgi:large subunit ribosomal protein L15